LATGEAALNSLNDHPDDSARVLIHDFRNLLAVIINYCELIAQETSDPEAVRTDIGEIRAAAERALALTDRLPRSSGQQSEPPPSTS
jgi:signal transduction histidine kinase